MDPTSGSGFKSYNIFLSAIRIRYLLKIITVRRSKPREWVYKKKESKNNGIEYTTIVKFIHSLKIVQCSHTFEEKIRSHPDAQKSFFLSFRLKNLGWIEYLGLNQDWNFIGIRCISARQ
jgi:hypothetical protein